MTVTKSIQSAWFLTQNFLCLQRVISKNDNSYKKSLSFLFNYLDAAVRIIKDVSDTLNTDNINNRFKIPNSSVSDNVQTIRPITSKLMYTPLMQNLINCNSDTANVSGVNIIQTIKNTNTNLFAEQSDDRKNFVKYKLNNKIITDSAQNFKQLSEKSLYTLLNNNLYNKGSKTANISAVNSIKTAEKISENLLSRKMYTSSIKRHMDLYSNINKFYDIKTLILKTPLMETADNNLTISLKNGSFNLLNKNIFNPPLYTNTAETSALKSRFKHAGISENKNFNYLNSNINNTSVNTLLHTDDKTVLLEENAAVISLTKHNIYRVNNNKIQSNYMKNEKIFNTPISYFNKKHKNINKFYILNNTSDCISKNINNICYGSDVSINKLFINIPRTLYTSIMNKNIKFINKDAQTNYLDFVRNKTKNHSIYALNISEKNLSSLTKTIMLENKLAETETLNSYNTKSPCNIFNVNNINTVSNLSNKDLISLREMTKYVKKNVYAQPVINVTTGDINEKADIDYLIKKIGQSVQEGMETSIEGVVNYV